MFHSRQLKQENKKLMADCEMLQERADKRLDEINKLKTELGNLQHQKQLVEVRLARTKEKLRNEAAADLLVSSLKLLFQFINEKDPPPKSELEKLRDQQIGFARMMQPLPGGSSYMGAFRGGLFSGLGL